jgi:hypothetical protein
MMGLNPNAVVFWAFLALVAHLVWGAPLVGLTVGIGISLLISLVVR